jgi:hypothetical protein
VTAVNSPIAQHEKITTLSRGNKTSADTAKQINMTELKLTARTRICVGRPMATEASLAHR